MCPRCQGYLVRDKGFESITRSRPAYHCVNCGRYIDLCILKNSELTLAERSKLGDHKHVPKGAVGDDPHFVSCVGSLLLDRGTVSSLW